MNFVKLDNLKDAQSDGTIIKILVFDLGNVLLPFNWEKAIKHLEEINEDSGRRFLQVLSSEIFSTYEKGRISTKQFCQEVISILDIKVDLPDFKHIFSDIFKANTELIRLLPILHKRYPLFLLSNTCEMHIDWIQKHFSLLENFDELLLSYQLGYIKPEEEIFREVLKRSGRLPDEHLYIDDIFEYIEYAKGMGFYVHHFVSQPTLLMDLKENGIIGLRTK